jgi:prepilin signal peptidase PulO-like enzyme (type II secretory pathway)
MAGIDYFAWAVFLMIVATVVGFVVFLGLWPGRVAVQRQHPYQDAITVGSWVALITGGILWPLILIWAYSTPTVPEELEQ